MNGIVRFFNDEKGYGFIAPEGGGKDVFAHYSSILMNGHRRLDQGDKVSFIVEQAPKGFVAKEVKKVGVATAEELVKLRVTEARQRPVSRPQPTALPPVSPQASAPVAAVRPLNAVPAKPRSSSERPHLRAVPDLPDGRSDGGRRRDRRESKERDRTRGPAMAFRED